MFTLNRKSRKAQAQVEDIRVPRMVEVFWRGHMTHPWTFLGKYDTEAEARRAAECMTTAQVDIRVHY